MNSKYFCVLLVLLGLSLSIGCKKPSDTSEKSTNTATATNTAPQVKVSTSFGDFVITLMPDKAPKTVEQFIKNVNNGIYNNTIVHNVVQDYAILIGGVSKTSGNPDSFEIANEASASNPNKRLTVAMLHQPEQTQSDSVQFFINMKDNPELNAQENGADNPEKCGYCVFGTVTDGMSVLDRINRVTVSVKGEFEFAPETDIEVIQVSVL